jgi:hypothetical protein
MKFPYRFVKCKHEICLKCLFKLCHNKNKWANKCPECCETITQEEINKYSYYIDDNSIYHQTLKIINNIRQFNDRMADILLESLSNDLTSVLQQSIIIEKFYENKISYLEMKALNV